MSYLHGATPVSLVHGLIYVRLTEITDQFKLVVIAVAMNYLLA